MTRFALQALSLLLSASGLVHAQTYSCPGAPSAKVPITTGPGFRFTPVVANLTAPRGIVLDSLGNILVVENGRGVSAHTVNPNGCVVRSKLIVSDTSLTHGIDVYGGVLYASSPATAWAWNYNPLTQSVSNKRVIITGMQNNGTKTRTLLVSRRYPNTLLVSVGSDESLDLPITAFKAPGTSRASVKAFDLTSIPKNGVNYTVGGRVVGYGLRNAVGIAEDRGGILHGADNAMDSTFRVLDGTTTNVSASNPAENVFNLGSSATPAGIFAGYPYCFTVWDPSEFPVTKFQTGDWFVEEPTAQLNDTSCYSLAKRPSTLLPAHTAPLGVTLGIGSDNNLYAALHGGYDPNLQVGYQVVSVAGSYSTAGEWSPNAPLSASRAAAVTVIANANNSTCTPGVADSPDSSDSDQPYESCFHPVNLAWSRSGNNLYVTSDTSGEIYLVKKTA